MATLSEAKSKELLSSCGVRFARERVVSSPENAAAAAAELGFPVVVKLNGDAIAHKTERGLVRLGLTGAAQVTAAASELLAMATPDDGPVDLLVAEQVQGRRELIAGVVRDPNFGPVVMLGIGGIFAEAIADAVFRMVPVSARDAGAMIDDLHTQALLGAWRGEPPVDRAALAALLAALSRAIDEHPHIRSIDVNPLIIAAGTPIAVDALVEVAP